MQELGYVEGRDITFEYRFADGKPERLPALAAELVRLKVDVILAPSTSAAQAAKQATVMIPIVIATAGNPVGDGLIASLARPGGHVTGLTMLAGPEIGGKYLALLKETVPRVSRVAVLWNPYTSPHAVVLREIEVAARSLGVKRQPLKVRGSDEIGSAFSTMTRERAEALVVLADPMFFSQRTEIADLAAKGRLPAMYGLREHVEAGGLMAYATSTSDLFRRAATYVDKILKGTKPADLPIEQPTRFELVINLKTAKALGFTIPQSLLLRADQVIQ
jgi:putative ABC transport system substrate-binding protein